MKNEPIDFDEVYPAFDPARFVDGYPSKDDYPPPYWNVAMRRVYSHELYHMARDDDGESETREIARRAWEAIEHNSVDAFVCDLAGKLWDLALDEGIDTSLEPFLVSAHLSIILWTAFRESKGSPWLQHVLHTAIGVLDESSPNLSVKQAFVAGWAAGRVDGEFEEGQTTSDKEPPIG